MDGRRAPERPAPSRGRAGSWRSAFVGLAIAIASIADMFSARPVRRHRARCPTAARASRSGRSCPGSPAEKAGIKAGECIQGIGKRIVNTSSDASEELRRHRIGEQVDYLVRNGACPGQPRGGRRGRSCGPCGSSSPPSGSAARTYLYAVVVGFLFFLIGLFVFVRRPAGALGADLLPALRPLPALLRLPPAARPPTGGSTSSSRTPARSASSCCPPSSSTSS